MSDDWKYKTAMEAVYTAYRQLAIVVIVALTIIALLIGVIVYLLVW